MPSKSRFSSLPHRIVVPPQPYVRRSTRALHVVSLIAATALVSFATVVGFFLKGCK